MNKRTKYEYGNIITRALPYHVQIYPLRQKQLETRFNNLCKLYDRNRAINYKKNSFIRKQLQAGCLLCYHCEKPLLADKLNVSNRKNMYHLKCGILVDLIPYERTVVTKNLNCNRAALEYKPEPRIIDIATMQDLPNQ